MIKYNEEMKQEILTQLCAAFIINSGLDKTAHWQIKRLLSDAEGDYANLVALTDKIRKDSLDSE